VTLRRSLAFAALVGAIATAGTLAASPDPGPGDWVTAVACGAVCAVVLAWRLRPDPKDNL
jgi:peptidoglycan/LPS O-acetylase OafA/YrhL